MRPGKKYVNFVRITSEKIHNYSDGTVNLYSSHTDSERITVLFRILSCYIPLHEISYLKYGKGTLMWVKEDSKFSSFAECICQELVINHR